MEKTDIFKRCYQELWNWLNYRFVNYQFEIDVEFDDFVFCFSGKVAARHIDDEYKITEIEIKTAWFQYSDFETTLHNSYLKQLETYILN
jgi:hypothetical protein